MIGFKRFKPDQNHPLRGNTNGVTVSVAILLVPPESKPVICRTYKTSKSNRFEALLETGHLAVFPFLDIQFSRQSFGHSALSNCLAKGHKEKIAEFSDLGRNLRALGRLGQGLNLVLRFL